MPFAIRRHRDWLFSVGDDRALRIWTMDGLQIFEKYGHGARPFALEIFEREKIIFTGGVDEYLCIWRWTGGGIATSAPLDPHYLITLHYNVHLFQHHWDIL
uniref:Uncharacterized protein n=1 Tax=Meloidogyne incognita TaxID=6306 RepID=A0A914LD56_MELIC